MATTRIAVIAALSADIINSTSSNSSITPQSLKNALTGSLFYNINVQSITATNFVGPGDNLTNIVHSVSTVATFLGVTLSAANILPGVASLSAINFVCPPWHIGLTGQPLHLETGANKISLQYTRMAEAIQLRKWISTQNGPLTGGFILTTPNTTVFNNQIGSNFELTDGRFFMMNNSGSIIRIYDSKLNIFTTPATGLNGQGGSSVMQLTDGRIMWGNYSANYFLIYEPRTNIVTTPSIRTPYSAIYYNMQLPNGNIILLSQDAGRPVITYDPYNDVIVSTPWIDNTGSRFAVYMENGQLYFTASTGTFALTYNPLTNTLTTPGGIFPSTAQQKFGRPILLFDGRIYCPPGAGVSSTVPVIYNPVSNSISTPRGNYFPGGSYTGGTTYGYVASSLPNGHVILVGQADSGVTNFQNVALIYDPVNDILYTPPGVSVQANGTYYNIELDDENNEYLVPYYPGNVIKKLATPFPISFPKYLRGSPFFS